MRIEGWLLDVSIIEDVVHLWIRDTLRGRVKVFDEYKPNFYAETTQIEAELLAEKLKEHAPLRCHC